MGDPGTSVSDALRRVRRECVGTAGAMFLLAYCGVHRLLFGNIAAIINSDARWRVLVNELLIDRG